MTDITGTPKVGFVSLGCPKALTDSELILTQLRAEGYDTSKTMQGADLVIVNTCGFIDDAVKESLDAIGEAIDDVIDDAIGEVLKALDASGRREDTVLIFMSDHGDYLGDHRIMLKGASLYQSIVRTPFLRELDALGRQP